MISEVVKIDQFGTLRSGFRNIRCAIDGRRSPEGHGIISGGRETYVPMCVRSFQKMQIVSPSH